MRRAACWRCATQAALRAAMPEARVVDHRYLQIARTLRKEIVDGVYPVGSQLPTEHQLCERFAVSRYTVREALRRLREDNLVSSRPRTGTLVVPPAVVGFLCPARHVDQRSAGIRDRHPVRDRFHRHGHDRRGAGRSDRADPRRAVADRLRCAPGRRREDSGVALCRTEYYINRAFAAVGRLLQRHQGPIFPVDRRPVRAQCR